MRETSPYVSKIQKDAAVAFANEAAYHKPPLMQKIATALYTANDTIGNFVMYDAPGFVNNHKQRLLLLATSVAALGLEYKPPSISANIHLPEKAIIIPTSAPAEYFPTPEAITKPTATDVPPIVETKVITEVLPDGRIKRTTVTTTKSVKPVNN